MNYVKVYSVFLYIISSALAFFLQPTYERLHSRSSREKRKKTSCRVMEAIMIRRSWWNRQVAVVRCGHGKLKLAVGESTTYVLRISVVSSPVDGAMVDDEGQRWICRQAGEPLPKIHHYITGEVKHAQENGEHVIIYTARTLHGEHQYGEFVLKLA